MTIAPAPKSFLFLQGPISPYFHRIGMLLRARGHAVHRINVCLGDTLFWPEPATDFTAPADEWPGFVAGFLARHAITDLILLGEQRPYHRVAITAAHAAGVAVTVTDFGYIRPDWIILERDGMNRDSRFTRDPDAIRALAEGLPPIEDTKLYADDFSQQAQWDMRFHLANLWPGRFRHFRSFQLHHPVPAYLGTGIALLRRGAEARAAATTLAGLPLGPRWLFAMQMETDYSIRAYSPFPDMDTPIDQAMAAFAHSAPPDGQLLIKVHPLDPGIKNWRKRVGAMARAHGVPERVHYLGAGNLDAMLLDVRGVITVNSTVGVRALQMGRALHVMGDAIYRVEGMAHQGRLEDFWNAPPPDAVLTDAFLRAIAACLHVRGVYYMEPGLTAAVEASAQRLEDGTVGLRL